MRRSIPFICATTLLCVAATTVRAQEDSSTRLADSRRLTELSRDAARQFAVARAESEQTRPTVGVTAAGPAVELTLDEATARAIERNLDVAVERLNPQIQDFNIARLRATYRPTVSSTISQRHQVQPPTSQLNGGLIVQNNQSVYNGALTQAVPWGGGDFTMNWNNQRQETNNSFANFNPLYNSNFIASYTQPLLRGFQIDGTRQQLRVTAINRDISDVQLKATITNTLSNVRNAYWDYVFAIQSVEVARQSVADFGGLYSSKKTLRLNRLDRS